MPPPLDRRAAVHAALGDPTRLRLVDRLALTDLAPGELSQALDLPSNLLAHHLNVLTAAGVVERVRSEGDRRRSYVRLVLDDPAVAVVVGAGSSAERLRVPRVVFVCTHSSARSHLATAAWERVSVVPAAAAGTRPAARVDPTAVAVAARHDLDLGSRRPAHVDDVLRPDDLVVAVCDSVHEELAAAGHEGARFHWSVPDPVRVGTDGAFQTALVHLTARVDRLGRAVTSSLERTP